MKIQFTFLFFLFSITTVLCQAILSGSITDGITGEPMSFADIIVYQNGELIVGDYTDLAGDYSLKLEAGNYDVVFRYTGCEKLENKEIKLKEGEETYLDGMLISGVAMDEVIVVGYKIPLVVSCHTWGCSLIGQTIMAEKEEEKVNYSNNRKYFDSMIYPNPVSSLFTIKSEREINDASIFNLSGQLVKTLSKGQTEVDVSNLLPGTYFLVITEGEIVQTEKIVIVRN